MLIGLASLLSGAGFARFGLLRASVIIFGFPLVVGVLIQDISGIPAFAFSVAIGCLAIEFEFLSTRARQRRKLISQVWPEVLDSLTSASTSGLTFAEAFQDLGSVGPEALRPHFSAVCARLDSGQTLHQSLELFQFEANEIHVDRLVMLLGVVKDAGGRGFHEALRQQAKIARDDLALWGELESKQGWVTGTAKVAIAAPWIIVTLLCSRPENVAAYASLGGSLILMVGLMVSAFAYQLIRLIARSQVQPRVFSL